MYFTIHEIVSTNYLKIIFDLWIFEDVVFIMHDTCINSNDDWFQKWVQKLLKKRKSQNNDFVVKKKLDGCCILLGK